MAERLCGGDSLYEEALYQVYEPLPYIGIWDLRIEIADFVVRDYDVLHSEFYLVFAHH